MNRFFAYSHFGGQQTGDHNSSLFESSANSGEDRGDCGGGGQSDAYRNATGGGGSRGGGHPQQNGNGGGGTAMGTATMRLPMAQSIFGSGGGTAQIGSSNSIGAYEDPFLQQARAAAALAEMDVKGGISQSVFSCSYQPAGPGMASAVPAAFDQSHSGTAEQQNARANAVNQSFQAEMAAALCQQQMMQQMAMQAHCFSPYYSATAANPYQHSAASLYQPGLPAASLALHQSPSSSSSALTAGGGDQSTGAALQQQHLQTQQHLLHSHGTPLLGGSSSANVAAVSCASSSSGLLPVHSLGAMCATGTAKQGGGGGGQPRYPTLHAAHLNASELDTDPRELERFAEHFKQRRIKLGVTQADVGKALACLKMPGVGSLSQSTICRFESLTLSHNNMVALKPILQNWLEKAEEAIKRAGKDGLDGLQISGILPCAEKKRKRTSIALSEKRLLEDFFRQQSRPTGDRISAIADKLDLKKNVVRVWFCNQRQKQKRNQFRNSRQQPYQQQATNGGHPPPPQQQLLQSAVGQQQMNSSNNINNNSMSNGNSHPSATAVSNALGPFGNCSPVTAAASLAAVAMQAMQQQQQQLHQMGSSAVADETYGINGNGDGRHTATNEEDVDSPSGETEDKTLTGGGLKSPMEGLTLGVGGGTTTVIQHTYGNGADRVKAESQQQQQLQLFYQQRNGGADVDAQMTN